MIEAWMALPLVATAISAYGAYKQGQDAKSAAAANARTYGMEGQIAATQGYEQEAQLRRKTGMILGSEQAAVGQAGAGYGGSAGRSLKQSAMNAELDALNVRYKSQLQKWSYTTQAGNIAQEGVAAGTTGNIRAGAALLRGYGNYANPNVSSDNDLG
jgi:hypothetical protein